MDRAWVAGAQAVMEQVGASGLAPRISVAQLEATRHFMTDRIADVSAKTVTRINTVLTQHLLGVRSMAEAVTDIQKLLDGAPRYRAMTIAYTEVGRAYSAAQYETMLAQAKIIPGLKKRWLHNHRRTPRPGHVMAAAEGPIPVAQAFQILDPRTGELEALRFPRDPKASASNTINCGCDMIAVTPKNAADIFSRPAAGRDGVPPGGVPPAIPPGGAGGGDQPPDPRFTGLGLALVQALRRSERAIALQAQERLHAFDADGLLIGAWLGDTHRVIVPDAALRQLMGAVATHNHATGTGFSVRDVRFAVGNRLAELRVVGPNGLYRLRQPTDADGWGDLAYLWTSPRMLGLYHAYLTSELARIRAANPAWPDDKINVALGEAAMLYFARTYGVRYSGLLP